MTGAHRVTRNLLFVLLCVPLLSQLATDARATQLLSNENFDLGPGGGWSETAFSPLIVDSGSLTGGVTPHTGTWVARLGNAPSTSDTLSQVVPVPANTASLTLSGVRWITTTDSGGAFDFVNVQLRSHPGLALIETLATWSNEDASSGWIAFELPVTDAGSLAGQSVVVSIESSNDFVNATHFHFDTLGFESAAPVPALPHAGALLVFALLTAAGAVRLRSARSAG